MNPYLKRWQRANKYPRDDETWEQFYERITLLHSGSAEPPSDSAKGEG